MMTHNDYVELERRALREDREVLVHKASQGDNDAYLMLGIRLMEDENDSAKISWWCNRLKNESKLRNYFLWSKINYGIMLFISTIESKDGPLRPKKDEGNSMKELIVRVNKYGDANNPQNQKNRIKAIEHIEKGLSALKAVDRIKYYFACNNIADLYRKSTENNFKRKANQYYQILIDENTGNPDYSNLRLLWADLIKNNKEQIELRGESRV
ncbi:MAG: hypothetical protein FWH02_02840 [Oscillospiraceae bacterium]|nr:hypothetical protein [Oscillospiraceae bacterium]